MATNNRPLKAYVRYDGSGRAVSSSLIWRKNKPKVGNWKEVQGYECCNPGGGTFTTEIVFSTDPEFPENLILGAGFIIFCEGNAIIQYYFEYPLGTTTIQESVDYLNIKFVGIATFSVINSNTISTTFSNIIVNTLCPEGTISIIPGIPG